MAAVLALSPGSGLTTAVCTALEVSRASVHRHRTALIAPPRATKPRPSVARAPQRLAVDGDHVTIAEQHRDLRQNPTEGRIQRLRVDHPEHRREGIMRWDGMPEFQEVSENMLFYAIKVRHLGTAGRPAEHRDGANDQQFAKVVARVVGAGIGDLIEGGEEDIHVGNGLQKGDPHPRIHPAQHRKTPRITSNPKRDSPAHHQSL